LVVILVLTGISCCIAGCSFLPFSGIQASDRPDSITTGFPADNQTAGAEEFRSEMRTDNLNTLTFPDAPPATATGSNESGTDNATLEPQLRDIHILYISGNNLDESGKASRWTYAIRHTNRTFLVTVDKFGMTMNEWYTSGSYEEVFPGQIITPAELFNRNRAVIFTTPDSGIAEQRDLMLGKTLYSLTVSGHGTPRVLTFDAKTGALL
jgi:hypothetical protein